MYSASFGAAQLVERAQLYGLYSGAYLNMHNYLQDIEAVSLSDMLANYNMQLAGLDTDETVLLNSIVAKRYLAGIDVLISDQKLATGELKRQAEEAEWDAKMAALETDRAALITLATKLAAEETKTEAKIAELQAKIATEEAALSLAEIEQTEKEIQLAQEDLKILRSAIEIGKIQTAVVQQGMEVIETELRKQRLIVDIAQLRNQIARTTKLEADLDIAVAHVAASTAELAAMEAELAAIEGREAIIDAEIAHQATLIAHITQMGAMKEDYIELQRDEKLQSLDAAIERNEIANQNKLSQSQIDKLHVESNQRVSESDIEAHRTVASAHVSAAWRVMMANIAAATKRRDTSIVTEMAHSISTGG